MNVGKPEQIGYLRKVHIRFADKAFCLFDFKLVEIVDNAAIDGVRENALNRAFRKTDLLGDFIDCKRAVYTVVQKFFDFAKLPLVMIELILPERRALRGEISGFA